jgi:hypothetical protein
MNIMISVTLNCDQRLGLTLSKSTNRVGASLPLPEDGNRISLRNVVFSRYLEFRTMDKVQKLGDSEQT